MPYVGIFGLELGNNMIMFEMNTLEFVQVQSFVKKHKMPKFGTKNVLFGFFGLEFQKAIVIFEVSTLEFSQNEFFIHRLNFGIGSIFSKGLGSTFSQDPGPGPDLLYKLC